MSKKIVLLPILVCSLFISCKKGQNENKQTQTEIKIEESAEKVIDEDKIEESSLEDDTKTVEIEYTSNGAIPNKYFTADDVFIAKGIEETIKIIDEEHFLSYICNLIKTDAQEKIAAYAPYQEKEISKESSEPVSFEDGYTFYPETIKLQVSDKDIVTMEKYSETTYEYDDDNRMEITVEKDGLDHISKKSKNTSYYKSRYGESENTYEYDEKGNLISSINQEGEKTQYLYDDNNNRIKEIYADGREITYDYENGLCICEHQPELTVYRKYDDKKNLIEKFIPEYSSTYKSTGAGIITNYFPKSYEKYFYDDSGKKIAEWYYNLEEESYEYDENGNLRRTFSTNAGENLYDAPEPSVQNENQDYENKRSISISGEEYDAKGNLIHEIIEDPCDALERWYMRDTYGNIVIERFDYSDGPDQKYFYEYDSNGNIIHKVESSGSERFFTYDENNKVKTQYYIYSNHAGYSIETFENGKIVKESSVTGSNNLRYYDGNNTLIDKNTTYKYDEHGNMIYSLGERGMLYVVYCKYEYDENGRILKMQEYHNY